MQNQEKTNTISISHDENVCNVSSITLSVLDVNYALTCPTPAALCP